MRSTLQVLAVVARNRQLRRVELAYATFNSAEWATWIAMLVYAYSHGGVTASGLVATGMLVPAALVAPAAANIGDRFAPGQALVAGYVLQAATCGAVAVALTSHAPAPLVYALLVGPAVAFTMTRPTQAAFTPGLAHTPRELAATNVASGWVESVSLLVAPVVAGGVLAVRGPDLVFALMGAGCALGAVLVLPLRNAVAATPPEQAGEASRFRSALDAVRQDPPARLLVLLLGGQCIAIGALDVLYVELARGVLHRGGDWAGYFNGAAGAGGVLAVAVTAHLVGRPRLAGLLVASLAVWSLAFIALSVRPTVISALLLFVVAGGAEVTFSVMARTLLQRVARPGLLGRVFGLLEGLQMAGYAIGSLLAPGLVAVGGPGFAFVGIGLVLPLIAVLAFRPLLGIDRHATVPVVEIALLRSLSLFSPLDAPTLESLARSLEPLAVPAGTNVVSQGDRGDCFYAIAEGTVDVRASGKPVATLSRGDYFGEIALMYGVPRTATVTAQTELQLYSLGREEFLLALTGHPEVQGVAEHVAQERLDRVAAVE